MENQMIQSLHSRMHYHDKLVLVNEIYHYLEINEHKRKRFFNIGSLIYGLVIWGATSYYQVRIKMYFKKEILLILFCFYKERY